MLIIILLELFVFDPTQAHLHEPCIVSCTFLSKSSQMPFQAACNAGIFYDRISALLNFQGTCARNHTVLLRKSPARCGFSPFGNLPPAAYFQAAIVPPAFQAERSIVYVRSPLLSTTFLRNNDGMFYQSYLGNDQPDQKAEKGDDRRHPAFRHHDGLRYYLAEDDI